MKRKSFKIGILSFIIVLLFMPIGHALMILIENILAHHKFLGAFLLGFIGVVLVGFSITKTEKASTHTLLGLLAGILVWTGWIEFSYVWIAEKLNTLPLVENGITVTKPEYLIMPSSIGLLGTFFVYYLFTHNKCQFFNWFQNKLRIKKYIKTKEKGKHLAIITFIETIAILWTFYMVLLLVYDNAIAGDKHPITYITAFGSLIWSAYLFTNLIKIQKFDYAIRYAVPTVIIFWNFVEILGRWNVFKEIWIHPLEYWLELTLLATSLLGLIIFYIIENRKYITIRKAV